ncbi:MAG TPA: ATP-binding protein, partial [Dyella sp.]|uniref:ATP-binding protein n=1 Tax=Dyella sp. TaxID=1869338 RepID=UPI002F9579ED
MNWRTSAWLRLGWVALLVFPCLAIAADPDFTSAERQWIKDHPVVRFASDSRIVPLEYLENGRYAGLVSGYLEAISRVSGLKFERVATESWTESEQAVLDGRADMLPNAVPLRVDRPARERLLFTAPYFSSPTLVITQANKPVILNLHELDGKKVAIRGGGINQYELRGRFPNVELVDFPGARDVLESTLRGDVYAAIGSDVVYMPLLRRRYVGRLSVSGVANDMPLTASMAVRKEEPLLFSIVSKSLEALSARETDVIYERWAEAADYGKPSVASLIIYRKTELTLLAAAIALLALFAWWAQVERRRAQVSELAKSRFLAVMSHEIRTPMNAVLASIEMLQPALHDPHNRKLAQTAVTAAESLLGLLDDVLDLSKLDAHQLDLESMPTDIERLARETTDIARVKAREKALSIRVSVDNPRALGAMVDPTRVRQILMNLLGNAIKFTHEGQIELVVRLEALTGDKGRLHISVSDTGIGIAPSQQARLFEAYTQADSSTTRRYGGTGLGLTICRELVEQMGGSIWLDSKEGEGTTVAFELPVSLTAIPLQKEAGPA